MAEDLRLLLDERAISRVLHRSCGAMDTRDMDALRSCYWPDGTDDHGFFSGGVDEFITWVGNFLERHTSTMHHLGTTVIDVDGDSASSVSAVVSVHVGSPADDPRRNFVAGGWYHDQFERREGEWRIVARRIEADWISPSVATPVGAGG